MFIKFKRVGLPMREPGVKLAASVFCYVYFLCFYDYEKRGSSQGDIYLRLIYVPLLFKVSTPF